MRAITNLTLKALTLCIACDEGSPTAHSFPLCEDCVRALIPTKQEENRLTSEWIASSLSLFRITDQTYQTLRRWKTRRGPLFDRRIFKQVDQKLLSNWISERQIASLIPMPQSYERSWKMRGSPAEVIAREVQRVTEVKILRCLSKSSLKGEIRQAELQGWSRMQTRIPFEADPRVGAELSVAIVDDFSTTGHTLEGAARALRLQGFREVHALCLGIRSKAPRLLEPDQEAD